MTDYPKYVIDISSVRELKGYIMDVNLILGAGVTLTEAMEIFEKLSSESEDFAYLKEFCNHLDLVAHIPVRNVSYIFNEPFYFALLPKSGWRKAKTFFSITKIHDILTFRSALSEETCF